MVRIRGAGRLQGPVSFAVGSPAAAARHPTVLETQRTSLTLRTYTNEPVKPCGVAFVAVQYNAQRQQLPFVRAPPGRPAAVGAQLATTPQAGLDANTRSSPHAVRGGKPGKNVDLIESDLKALCRKVREVLLSQPMLLELEAPIQILGDTHGQFYDTLRLFEYGGFPPESNYLFLGDYVDRGRHSLENVCLLFCYKVKYPENFFLLRGNHESASINRVYGFYDECKRRFNIKMFKTFEDVFNCLPVAALVSDKIFCMHGDDLWQSAAPVEPSQLPTGTDADEDSRPTFDCEANTAAEGCANSHQAAGAAESSTSAATVAA
ncbi:hypothetical protein MRX96_021563 [Rhipicephalus microplus]